MSIGGRHLQSLQMLIHLRIIGMSSKNTCGNKDKLVNGIAEFWKTVDQAKCKEYIRHLRKVLPRTIVKAFLKVIFVGYVKKVASSKRLTLEAIQKLS